MFRTAVTFCFALLVPVTAAAQASEPVPVLLRSPIPLRSAGMNGAAASLVGDAGSVFTNPAGLATIRHIALEGGYRTMPLDGRAASAALGMRLRQFDLGFGLAVLDRGFDLARRIDSLAGAPLPTDPTFNDFEGVGVASLVYRRGMIAIGATAKGVRQRTEAETRKATAVDAGFAIAIFDIMAIGFSTQNIGGNLRSGGGIKMPRLTRFGGMLNYVDPQESFRLLSTFELQWPEGEGTRLVLGVEAGAVVSGVGIRLRGGWGSQRFRAVKNDITYGASIELGTANVDWAYQERGLFDEAIHRFGIRLRL